MSLKCNFAVALENIICGRACEISDFSKTKFHETWFSGGGYYWITDYQLSNVLKT